MGINRQEPAHWRFLAAQLIGPTADAGDEEPGMPERPAVFAPPTRSRFRDSLREPGMPERPAVFASLHRCLRPAKGKRE